MQDSLLRLARNLYVHRGTTNVGILVAGDRAALIDYGEGDVEAVLDGLGVRRVEAVFITHVHRDQVCGLAQPAGRVAGCRVVVPAAERAYLDAVEPLWRDPARRWHAYDFRPGHLLPSESIPASDVCRGGEDISWRGWRIGVYETPGHTDGSVSYVVECDGGRFAFCGDALAGPGQVWELYSLQRGGTYGPCTIRDYHGYLGARGVLLDGLARLGETQPAALIPAHGPVVDRPAEAIAALAAGLTEAFALYASAAALRHYFPPVFAEVAGREDCLPIQAGTVPPAFLRHVGTSWIVIAESGAALVMDCGSPAVIEELQRLLTTGEIRRIEGLWISHYHDDHVDALPAFQRAFPCPTIADPRVAAVVSEPRAFRLPGLSPAVVRVDRRADSGESWEWREFRLTTYHFPGQTYYHGALLVEGHGLRLLFAGDSFTPAGMDDYCPHNRTFLGPGRGYDACLGLLAELHPDLLFNCHVDVAWRFPPEHIARMRALLAARERVLGRLVPWDDPNYGLDEHWVRCQPYEQEVAPGAGADVTVRITNHSAIAHEATCQPVLPRGWASIAPTATTIPARADGGLRFRIPVPAGTPPGQYVIPFTLDYAGRRLAQFREALITVPPSPTWRPPRTGLD
jgi:glyoxylase-like metal-dependent hydrolase (beta-lactamase superfamily II)